MKNGRPRIDLLGQRFGKLVVVEFAYMDSDEQARWKCLCDCGKTHVVRGNCLRRGTTKSCGCGRYEIVPPNKLPDGVSDFNRMYADYKDWAGKRNREFSLTKDEFKLMINSVCQYCGREPQAPITKRATKTKFVFNGIDRVDNTKGYTVENCVPCCNICNRAKKNMTLDEFKQWIDRLTERNR